MTFLTSLCISNPEGVGSRSVGMSQKLGMERQWVMSLFRQQSKSKKSLVC